MTISEWKDLVEMVKSLLEACAIVAAGVWATYTFGSLRQIAKARAEIANTEATRRKTEAEVQALSEKAGIGAVIEIELAATPLKAPNDSRLYLSVIAEVSNKGNRNAHIAYPDQLFRVYAVNSQHETAVTHTFLLAASLVSAVDPTRYAKNLLVRAGGREWLPFLVPVPGPGVYLLVLSLPASAAEQEIAKQSGFSPSPWWSAKRYVVVPAA